MPEWTQPTKIGDFYVNGCVVCRGCGVLVYTAADALTAHVGACDALRKTNADRLSGSPT